MSKKPRLPSRPEDTWEGGFLFDAARDVRSVNARGGLVIAGGAELYLLRPGAQRMMSRPPPLDIGPVRVAAAEPRGARRYAVASEEMVAIFYRNKLGDQLLRLRPSPPGPVATHLAWGGAEGPTTLYVRWDDGVIARLNQDMTDLETLDIAPMDAVAADEAGVVAMVSLEVEQRVYVTRDGEHMHFRPVELRADGSQHVHLAVAGMAVAVAVEHGGVFVSRGEEDPFVPCEPLAAAGPVEFEGSAAGAALFGAVHQASMGSIVRVDAAGAAMRIAEFGSEEGAPPEVTSLTWDASRRTLLGASPQAGLLTSAAPGGKRGQKVLLS